MSAKINDPESTEYERNEISKFFLQKFKLLEYVWIFFYYEYMNSFIVSQRGHIQYKSIIDAWTPEEDRLLCTNFYKYDGDLNKLLQLLPNR